MKTHGTLTEQSGRHGTTVRCVERQRPWVLEGAWKMFGSTFRAILVVEAVGG